MPTTAFASIEGSNQGNMSQSANSADSIGNNWVSGQEDNVTVIRFDQNATVPRNPQSGQPAGQRIHQPATLVKPLDKASPMLWQALATGETLTITVNFYRTSTTGQQEHYYTIKFTDCVLCDGKTMLPDVLDQDNASRAEEEAWSFTYRKADWTHEKAGTSASDDYREPVT